MLSTATKGNPQRIAVAKGFVIVTLLFFAIAQVNHLFVSVTGMTEWSAGMFTISRCFYWLWLGCIYLYVTRVEQQPLLLWPEKSYGVGFYLASVFGIIFTLGIGNVAITYALYFAGLYKTNEAVLGLGQFSLLLKIFISLTAGIVEELVMRGYLMPRLQLFFRKSYWPVIISSILFGIAHARWGTLANVLVPMFIGFIFACHYQKYRNIRVLICCHFAWDMISLLMLPHGGE
ncbi:CPBP family intramembrane glutamic endopeptidase [Mucilaginibacter psychrotolerans]|uniref:CPBP family intramembrane metalloprotease n=1 Tax=Mucilaginibacter psychrotolerans TaxID=1524096 RepID=A0A4Y8S2W5_9SPHI|nr:type II CAAX endopeptidase family protein [Mucilaginibacter psychrotolerans]TFF33359.1 CPBP family intramembrane metalloprotease [Mucilaginibacter psychrotolerans]